MLTLESEPELTLENELTPELELTLLKTYSHIRRHVALREFVVTSCGLLELEHDLEPALTLAFTQGYGE